MSAPNRKVAWIKPQEPSFLKAFKAKVGYKEPDTIEAKRPKVAPAGAGEGDDEEREDELPTVVMLEEGDVGEEEYKRFREAMKEMKKAEEEKDGEDGGSGVPAASPQSSGDQQSEGDSGRIIFKRPAKRRRSSEGVLDASTKKTGGEAPASRGPGSKNKSPKTRKRSSSSSGVKNSSLLSFGDEEEEDN